MKVTFKSGALRDADEIYFDEDTECEECDNTVANIIIIYNGVREEHCMSDVERIEP